ncbi:hypothetical protein FRC18_011165 [Serendipita sp. 400]|nr:hypothetical protein FRC18_011165 [Serendipita sp. 400]
MEVEPLQDGVPNRYAFESDDSEDDIGRNAYPGVPDKTRRTRQVYDVDIVWNMDESTLGGKNMYVAIGQAGLAWASGVQLGAPTAEIQLKDIKVASVHFIEQDGVLVLVLKYELPISAMNVFASKVLSTFNPSRVTIVDGYSSPAYIRSSRKSDLDHPIRYLQTACAENKITSKGVKPFRPPNLLLSTSAAFLGILEQGQRIPGLLLLLPFPQIERPPPRTIEPIRTSVGWPEKQVVELNDTFSPSLNWSADLAKDSGRLAVSNLQKQKKSDSADMSMYI